jgi:adenylosuccinate lyase
MIPRYSRQEITKIWSEEQTYQYWLDIELAALRALEDLAKVPSSTYEKIKTKASFNIERIHELEKDLQHDILAFLTCVSETINSEESRYVHLGLTSSDIKDTALNLAIRDSGIIIDKGFNELLETLKSKALEYKGVPCVARSHGIHAEPTSFGLKLLNFYADIERSRKNFNLALEDLRLGMFSGAVGTYANTEPAIEEYACKYLNLKPVNISTQVISRDLYAHLVNSLAVAATCVEKIAVEIRHLQRTEVLELEEPFYEKQKGSSAMPHKRNPWKSENLSGLARLMRAYASACLEDIVLWHERDMSHSAVERVALVDALILMDFMLNRIAIIIKELNVYPQNMMKNLNSFGGVIFSQKVLLKLIDKGLLREDAYAIMQRLAKQAWNKEDGDFKNLVKQADEVLSHLNLDEIESCFDYQQDLNYEDFIFQRVLGISS